MCSPTDMIIMACIFVCYIRDRIAGRAARARSKQIDLQLKADGLIADRKVKILIVGTENAGKSTLMKQFKIIHEKDYSKDECLQYRPVVYRNTKQSMIAIIRAMGQLKIDFGHKDAESDARQFFALAGNAVDEDLTEELVTIMKRLWKDTGVQECVSRSREYQLNNSADYFLNALDRLSDPNYIPTERDILMSKGKGNTITVFTLKNLHFELYNFQYQIWQHEKIRHYFEDITAILFVADMSDYDIEGDTGMSRLEESMQLFDSVCNHEWLTETYIILFLNKKDLFEEKIKKSPLNCCFPEYTGSNTYEDAATYIQQQFENLNKKRDTKEVYSYFTCCYGLETKDMNNFYGAASDIIIKSNMKRFSGLF